MAMNFAVAIARSPPSGCTRNIHYDAIVASQIAMDIAVEAMVCQPGRKEVFIS
jgi:hypothetical protein